ncbi:type II toxin-antitoxin system PemK/MazF family toxin [Kineosporia sp. NBRC 101731]|uniref:type II toxin-antitoxin system PemK/MazF family toxin n=1 Tax=Kineosporia sp. NBRC 101731 TaxID=3032199 RepID=UPI0024A1B9AE|nr:type II toxin-antitoxin system PemK/MazF family toxin [Kineosporia sp. NBRC 101731]GLY32211.1 hypothetical protein Kisp02_55760 [Kineosporia sp. NBRC 101731]
MTEPTEPGESTEDAPSYEADDRRPIVWANLDKERNALVMTRLSVYDARNMVSLAPITSTIRGLASEVRVGRRNGLHHDSVAQMDNIQTVPKSLVLRHAGFLLDDQEAELAIALEYAYNLQPPTP